MTVALLALESASSLASVAVRDPTGRLVSADAQSGQSHSSQLLPLAEGLLNRLGEEWRSLHGLVVGVGPGSFTGIRIACGIAQGICLGLDRLCYPVSGFEAAAYAWWSTHAHGDRQQLLIAFDARLGESFAALMEVSRENDRICLSWIASPAVVGNDRLADFGREVRDDSLLVRLTDPDVRLMGEESLLLAGWMLRYASDSKWDRPSHWVAAAALEPIYVRDKVAQTIAERQDIPDLSWADMRAEDIESVLAIELEAYPFPWTEGNFRDSFSAGYRLRLLRERGVLVGYLVWMPVLQEAHLLNITLAPARQGHGLGAWMMRQAMEQMRAEGMQHVLLEVRPSNVRALGLYGRLRFSQIGLRKGYYPQSVVCAEGREDAVVMRINLQPAASVSASDRRHDNRRAADV